MVFLVESAPYPFGHDTGITMAVLVFPSKSNTSRRMRVYGQLSARKQKSAPKAIPKQSFTINQAANDLYIRITSIQNGDRLLLDDFELTDYTLRLDTPQHPVSLYPNPASHVVYGQGNKLPEKVQLYTLTGQLVDEQVHSKAIPVRDLRSGLYLVKIHIASQGSESKIGGVLVLVWIKDVIEQFGQSQSPFVKAVANQRKVFLLVSIA